MTLGTPSPAGSLQATTLPAPVTIKLGVRSVSGDFGDYIVDVHDGQPAKQITFHADSNGEWSKTITVPNDSMVKLDISRISATCEITFPKSGAVLTRGENSCIVGS